MDIDNKKIICCKIQTNKREKYQAIKPAITAMKAFVEEQKSDGSKINLVYEISGLAGKSFVFIGGYYIKDMLRGDRCCNRATLRTL